MDSFFSFLLILFQERYKFSTWNISKFLSMCFLDTYMKLLNRVIQRKIICYCLSMEISCKCPTIKFLEEVQLDTSSRHLRETELGPGQWSF